ncbi:MAG TPA: co-chaperone GroES [Kiritimatiellia bacterium]|nr:co-chaperone GroES [Kiritimatiellia bacterium]
MKLVPMGDRVLVELVKEEEVVRGGIYIPDAAKEKSTLGKVVATGNRDAPFSVKKGDKVLLPKYGGTEIKLDGKEYQMLPEEDLLGVLEE